MNQKMLDALINGMCMTYRHDFGLLDEKSQEALRTTMRQIYQHNVKPYIDTALSNAPQVVTLEAAEEIAQAGVPAHWQSPTSRSVIRHALTALERNGLKVTAAPNGGG